MVQEVGLDAEKWTPSPDSKPNPARACSRCHWPRTSGWLRAPGGSGQLAAVWWKRRGFLPSSCVHVALRSSFIHTKRRARVTAGAKMGSKRGLAHFTLLLILGETRAVETRGMVDRFRLHGRGGDGGNGCISLRRSRSDHQSKPDGSETMFADLGHFSYSAIQLAFTSVVYPALILAYMGQAAYLSKHHDFYSSSQVGFYIVVPGMLLYFSSCIHMTGTSMYI